MTLATILAYAAVGSAVGALWLVCLWAGARSISGPRPVRGFLGWAAARAALVLGALWAWAALGAQAGALAAGLAGFLALRVAATRRVRRGAGGAAWR